MKMKKTYFLIVLFLCGLSIGNLFASASAAAATEGHLGHELRAAAREGNESEVKELIARGADVNAADRDGWTALMWAAREGHKNIVERLLQVGADVNAADPRSGFTALMGAAIRGHENIVKLLLDARADKDLQTTYGRTAEAMARAKGNEDIANMIRDYVPSGRLTKSAGKR